MTSRRVVAKTVFVNEKDEALVLRRSFWPEQPERNHQPDFPGGLVESGETERHGAAREAAEEAGLRVDPLSLELIYSWTKQYKLDGPSITQILFLMRLDNTPKVILSSEHEAFDWIPLKDLPGDYEFSPFYREALAYAHEKNLLG